MVSVYLGTRKKALSGERKEDLKATNVASDWLHYSILFVYTVKN